MLKDKAGNRLFRTVEVKVFFPESILPPKLFKQHAEAGKGFGDEGITAMLFSIEEQLTTLYPFWEFQLVELAPEHRTARFVMTFAKYRVPEAVPDFAPHMPNLTAECAAMNKQTPQIANPEDANDGKGM